MTTFPAGHDRANGIHGCDGDIIAPGLIAVWTGEIMQVMTTEEWASVTTEPEVDWETERLILFSILERSVEREEDE